MTHAAQRLREQFGEIDIHLFDQLLRGRITDGMRVLDAGCGGGRNLVYFLREGFDVWGVDERADAVTQVRRLAATLAPRLDGDHFRVEPVEAMSFTDLSMDVVISSAVLHFARDDAHWMAMVREMWRVLAPGGLLFARLATTVAQPEIKAIGHGRFLQLDGSTRYLVSHERLLETTALLGGTLLDPVRSTVVHGLRSMGTWVVRKD
jgi:SAM-dependent methyltransferase